MTNGHQHAGSPIKITSPGWKLSLCVGLSIGAFAARTPLMLGVTMGANLVTMIVFRPQGALLRGAAKVLFIQTMMVTALHCLRFGITAGIRPGLITSMQLFLAFFPSVIFISTTSPSQVIGAMELILPNRAAFVAGTCLVMIPMLLRELKTIYQVQLFRGARILPKDLLGPKNWPDVANCLLVPAVIHIMVRAQNIAMAAQAREYGKAVKRTLWPGE